MLSKVTLHGLCREDLCGEGVRAVRQSSKKMLDLPVQALLFQPYFLHKSLKDKRVKL